MNNEAIEVDISKLQEEVSQEIATMRQKELEERINSICLLYTSDAADE